MCVFVKMTCDASDASDALFQKIFNNYADLPIEVRRMSHSILNKFSLQIS